MSLDNNFQMYVCVYGKSSLVCGNIRLEYTLLQPNYETALLLLQMYL